MAFVKITDLPTINETVLPLTAGDVMPIVHGATTYQVKLSTLQQYFNLNIALSAAGFDEWVQVNDHGQLSAFGGFIYRDALSGLQVGYDNILTGLNSSILGGASNIKVEHIIYTAEVDIKLLNKYNEIFGSGILIAHQGIVT